MGRPLALPSGAFKQAPEVIASHRFLNGRFNTFSHVILNFLQEFEFNNLGRELINGHS
jgi:hypothetical protein